MTPRPADEARRALRAARERGEATPVDAGADAGTESAAPAGADPHARAGADLVTHAGAGATDHEPVREQDHARDQDLADAQAHARDGSEHAGPRPGDVARAALRSARNARHAAADGTAGEGETPRGTADRPRAAQGGPVGPDVAADPAPGSSGAPGTPGIPGTPAEEADRPGEAAGTAHQAVPDGATAACPADRPDDAPDTATGPATTPGAATASAPAQPPTGPAPATVPGTTAGEDSRPADVAREALRAARRQARADTAARGAAGARRPARPALRPRGTGGSSTGEARARVVRDFAADAFRLPPEADPVEEPQPLEEPTGATAAKSPQDAVTSLAEPASAPESPRTPSHEPPPPLRQAAPHPEARGRTPYSVPRGQDPSSPPAPPRAPRSMAAPDRDGDLRRTFPALPPRTSSDDGFAETWWGNAWVTALEEGALDPKRLVRGRGYAEQGHVDAITVTPGLVLAYVQGSRPRPYRVQVRLRTLGDADWERFLDTAAERPGHIAALLDKELPHSLADCGVPLLPGPGDLAPQCSCPDSGHPCKHAAALCYQTARLLDADPFVLLLLRGRGERDLLDALSRLSAARAARAAQDKGPAPLPGVRATEALAARSLPPLPAPLPAPPHPEQPPAYPAAPGGPDPFALDQLATDAAARAHALLTTGRDPVGGLTLWQDAVRHAAARPGSGLTAGTRALYSSLARAAGRSTSELARAVAAWRQGGLDGLTVLEEPWDPPAGRFDRARPLLLAADLPAFRPWRNHLTHPSGHLQLRLGRTGLWYAYESEPGRDDWWPRGTPDLDPVGALTGLGGAEAFGGC
ncbi:SWIM zinc finger family protein [Streptomyces flaveolus]|uniref:SWIM zinc finger family protein n=1 Tax=Streptomyces flaveolus TaxID=67297 RepID=UPI00381ECFF6